MTDQKRVKRTKPASPPQQSRGGGGGEEENQAQAHFTTIEAAKELAQQGVNVAPVILVDKHEVGGKNYPVLLSSNGDILLMVEDYDQATRMAMVDMANKVFYGGAVHGGAQIRMNLARVMGWQTDEKGQMSFNPAG